MDGWTIILLPTLHDAAAMDRTKTIADWVVANEMDTSAIGISSRIIRFKNQSDATFFNISFKH